VAFSLPLFLDSHLATGFTSKLTFSGLGYLGSLLRLFKSSFVKAFTPIANFFK